MTTQCLKGPTTNYFHKEITILRICGTSLLEDDSIAYRIYSTIYVSLFLSYPILAFGDLFKHDFDVVSDLLIYELASIMTSCEVLVVLFSRSKLIQILKKLQEQPFIPNIERGGYIELEIIKQCTTVTSKQAIICWLSVTVTVGMATVFTLIKRIQSNDFNDWEFTYGPLTFINVTYSPNYEIIWFYQIFCTFSIGINHCTINLIMAGILAHASVQFRILQNNITRMVENAHRFKESNEDASGSEVSLSSALNVSDIPWKYLKKSLEQVIRYHLSVLEITKEVGEIFSNLLLTVFLFSLGVLCFLVFHASLLSLDVMRLFKTFTDSMSALFPILLLCYWSEEVAYESQLMAKSVMESSFAGTDVRFQKGVNMIIQRSQKPVQLRAGKFIEISLRTFVWIVRTSYSAFMMLRKLHTQ